MHRWSLQKRAFAHVHICLLQTLHGPHPHCPHRRQLNNGPVTHVARPTPLYPAMSVEYHARLWLGLPLHATTSSMPHASTRICHPVRTLSLVEWGGRSPNGNDTDQKHTPTAAPHTPTCRKGLVMPPTSCSGDSPGCSSARRMRHRSGTYGRYLSTKEASSSVICQQNVRRRCDSGTTPLVEQRRRAKRWTLGTGYGCDPTSRRWSATLKVPSCLPSLALATCRGATRSSPGVWWLCFNRLSPYGAPPAAACMSAYVHAPQPAAYATPHVPL